MPKITAFIARSFSKQDEARLRPTLEFLESFRKFGFLCESAEPAEVESVSAKVRRIIDDSDVLIGFFTRRHPIYGANQNKGLTRFLKPTTPVAWTAPPWVLQESGYALAKSKKLILLREKDVEIPGLQGDLEYVPFIPEKASDVFAKLSEMIHEIMADAAGIKVETVVKEQGQAEPTREEALVALAEQPAEAPTPDQPDKPSIWPSFFELIDAAAESDYDKLESAYQEGKALIDQKKVDMDPLVWECMHFEYRFKAGAAAALDSLWALSREHPSRHEPLRYIADILVDAKEYVDAAELYQKAAMLTGNVENKTVFLIKSARAFEDAKLSEKAYEIVWQTYQESSTYESRREASAALYDILKNKKESILAFAIAEAALHDNPQHAVRFRLGLDYHNNKFNNLFLLHFKYICDNQEKNASALHNLALALSECGLPVSSVSTYKRAISLGETLSAANLAYKYLDAGMADNAKEILRPAMQIDDHEPNVDKCYAEIDDRVSGESNKQANLLDAAQSMREFLIKIGKGLMMGAPSVAGVWKLPFGDIALSDNNGEILGAAEITTQQSGLGSLFGGTNEKNEKTEVYTFKGSLTGAVCKFSIDITTKDSWYNTLAALGGSAKREGFIVFNNDAQTGTYAEIKDHEIGARKLIRRRAKTSATS